MTDLVRPTYIGIGAQKCASTWLHRILEQHPEVAVAEEKELNFFSYFYDHGFEWYERHFSDCASARAIGEFSPSYFCEHSVPERLARYAPDIKILLSLRDPVERALSNHRHEVRTGHLTGRDLSFERGLSNNPMYIEQGLYATYLGNWLRYFSKSQILVVLMEDIETDPLTVCRTVYRFVGVDENYQPHGVSSRYNQSFATRSAALTRVKDAAYGMTRSPGSRWLWNLAAGVGLRKAYRGVNKVSSNVAIPQAKADTVRQLKVRFESEIRMLEPMIGRSLAAWLKS